MDIMIGPVSVYYDKLGCKTAVIVSQWGGNNWNPCHWNFPLTLSLILSKNALAQYLGGRPGAKIIFRVFVSTWLSWLCCLWLFWVTKTVFCFLLWLFWVAKTTFCILGGDDKVDVTCVRFLYVLTIRYGLIEKKTCLVKIKPLINLYNIFFRLSC